MGSITIYDGANTIGGTKIYLEQGGDGIFLDFGMNFKTYGKYFQQYLRPRTSRGIYDLISLGLIPKLNIYRRDLIPSDLDISAYPSLNVKGVLLSHAHKDHYGNIGLLDPTIPIISSLKTIALLKGIRDCYRPSFDSETAYFSTRVPTNDDRCIKSDPTSNRKYMGRDFFCTTDAIPIPFLDFFRREKSSRKPYDYGDVCKFCEYSSSFTIHPFEVDHSIIGSTAYKLEGDTTIAYTGDFRLHGKKGDKSKQFFKNSKDASILIIEGTRTSIEDPQTKTEDQVYENCLDAAEKTKGLIIADFAGRNFERLKIFQKIAEKLGRTLLITAKTAYLLYALESADGLDRLSNIKVYNDLRTRSRSWEENIFKTQKQIDYVDPFEVSKDPENYIVSFSFYDINNLLDIKPENGAYIYSSSEAFEEESEFDFIRLKHWLDHLNIKTYGFDIVKDKPVFEKKFHTSGHVSTKGLSWAIDTIDPDILIPVHTENPDWFKSSFDNTIILENGLKFQF